MKISLTCFLLLSTVSFMAVGQKRLKFENVSTMPKATYAFGYAEGDEKVFLIGGMNEQNMFNSNVQFYNTKVNLWFDLPFVDVDRFKYSSAIYFKEYDGLLVTGGIKPYGTASTVLMDDIIFFDLQEYTTKQLGKLVAPAKKIGIAKAGKEAYFFGGTTSQRVDIMNGNSRFSFSDKMYSYSLEDGKMKELPNLPTAMETKGGIYDDKLYVFGGFNGHPLKEVWQFDIHTHSWSQLADLRFPVSSYAIAQHNEYFLLVGDFHNVSQLILFNAKDQKVSYFKTNLKLRHPGAAAVGDHLHVFGGMFPEELSFRHYKIALEEIIAPSE